MPLPDKNTSKSAACSSPDSSQLDSGPTPNAISVDVEDYYHARNIELLTGRRIWASLPSRVNYSTKLCLELFKKRKVKGTFFVLGAVARKDKALIREIQKDGHEIASHGFRHHLAYEQSEKAFYRDICCSKKLLEDITGAKIEGYRAPNFSITDKNQSAYEALLKAGYTYDSSLYPVYHPRYNNLGKPLEIHKKELSNGNIYIAPLAVLEKQLFGKTFRLGVAGGAYWRIFPELLIRYGLANLKKMKRPAICYLHPWELDKGQKIFHELGFLQRLRHYGGISGLAQKIDNHLLRHSWVSIKELIDIHKSKDPKSGAVKSKM